MKIFKPKGQNTATDSEISDNEETHYTSSANKAPIKPKWNKKYADNQRKKRQQDTVVRRKKRLAERIEYERHGLKKRGKNGYDVKGKYCSLCGWLGGDNHW